MMRRILFLLFTFTLFILSCSKSNDFTLEENKNSVDSDITSRSTVSLEDMFGQMPENKKIEVIEFLDNFQSSTDFALNFMNEYGHIDWSKTFFYEEVNGDYSAKLPFVKNGQFTAFIDYNYSDTSDMVLMYVDEKIFTDFIDAGNIPNQENKVMQGLMHHFNMYNKIINNSFETIYDDWLLIDDNYLDVTSRGKTFCVIRHVCDLIQIWDGEVLVHSYVDCYAVKDCYEVDIIGPNYGGGGLTGPCLSCPWIINGEGNWVNGGNGNGGNGDGSNGPPTQEEINDDCINQGGMISQYLIDQVLNSVTFPCENQDDIIANGIGNLLDAGGDCENINQLVSSIEDAIDISGVNEFSELLSDIENLASSECDGTAISNAAFEALNVACNCSNSCNLSDAFLDSFYSTLGATVDDPSQTGQPPLSLTKAICPLFFDVEDDITNNAFVTSGINGLKVNFSFLGANTPSQTITISHLFLRMEKSAACMTSPDQIFSNAINNAVTNLQNEVTLSGAQNLGQLGFNPNTRFLFHLTFQLRALVFACAPPNSQEYANAFITSDNTAVADCHGTVFRGYQSNITNCP